MLAQGPTAKAVGPDFIMGGQVLLVGQGRRIAPLVILVLALHAALLAVPVRSARPDHAFAQAAQMHVRLISSSPAAAPPATAEEPPHAPAHPLMTESAAAIQAPTEGAAAAAPPSSPATTTQLAVAPASASPPVPKFGLVLPGIDSDGDYFPRALLSKAPSPLDAVVIDYPLIENDSGHHVSELTLFIDETGRVARVRVDGAPLPAALEDAARRAFAGSQFRAGEVDGRAVKSQIRIEVVFDNRLVDRPVNRPANRP